MEIIQLITDKQWKCFDDKFGFGNKTAYSGVFIKIRGNSIYYT